jgi:putative ABC transport system ATP-binding protein
MSEPFILCDGLVKIYQVAELEMVALRELNLTIEKGELVSIVGSSGSGKTTLMNILGGLDRPSAGRVRVDGLDLLKLSDRQLNKYRREKVGFVWQQSARNLVPYLNAIDNVMLPMTLAGTTGKAKRQRAEELLDLVGLKERMRHHLPELSGGEQQRVAIAVSLANNPTLLLADEPTGEVDSTTAETIYNTFRTLTGEMGITTIIVSHDPGVAKQVQRVVAIRDGMLASETIRQRTTEYTNGASGLNGEPAEVHATHTDHFQELVVVDRAGRLHVPQELLQQFNIKGRAQLEITETGILIRPTDSDRVEQEIPRKIGAEGGQQPEPVAKGLFGKFSLRRGKKE